MASRARSACRAPFLLLCGLASLLVGCEGHSDEPLVLARDILLYEDEPQRTRLGALRFEAGFVLTSSDPTFGGLSGLWVAPDGRELIAVSDHGTIWSAALEHDGDRLVGFADWSMAALQPIAGDRAQRIDAESLADDGAGGLVIAVEGPSPLRRVPRGDPGATATPVSDADALRAAGMAGDKGIEALTALPDGALLALSEGSFEKPGQLAGRRIDDGRLEPLHYLTTDGFVPTGADLLDDEIYVVERRVTLLDGGFATRLVVLDASQVAEGATLTGRELARIGRPAISENFEGIAARRGADGRILLYLVSDDNFLWLQRTLLLQFSLAP